eukprot:TRINITY_DN231_c0_g1_i2.p1 TRINITY_DN231_c0_g1~~TRINITY_DN231_c0_g1_i2.p1  ORF type:complete len:163 (-),score=4.91 TRINITY_DN231_c0_g1_i2:49-537(-)
MVHSWGYRARTRHMFAQPFRRHGFPGVSKYLVAYKRGDYVDIKGNGAVQKGMPHKYYHGRTGIVWNVTPRAVGVAVNKKVNNRIVVKRIHVRIEHVSKSRSREEFQNRIKHIRDLRAQAKKDGKTVPKELTKRLPTQPRNGEIVQRKSVVETVFPSKFEYLM